MPSQTDHLMNSLSYKIPPNSGASYVTERRAVTYFPMGSNICNPSTRTRQIRFNLASDQFIDLSSLAISFDLNMGATGIGTPLVDGAHAIFIRLRWIINGTVVEDLEYFNVASEMFHRLTPGEKKENTENYGFGGIAVPALAVKNMITTPKTNGLCSQQLWVPGFALGAQGCQLELTLADGPEIFLSADGQNTQYAMSNVRALVDVYTISNELHNTFSNHILSGKSLVFPFKTLTNTLFTLQQATPSFDLNLARSFSRLNILCFVFYTGRPPRRSET